MVFKKKKPCFTQKNKTDLQRLFSRTRSISLVYLLGSLAAGKANKNSDIDLAVLFEREPKPSLFIKFTGAVMSILKFPHIDVVSLNTATPVFCYEATASGKLLYSKSDKALNKFEMRSHKIFCDTEWMRKRQMNILKENYGIQKNGR